MRRWRAQLTALWPNFWSGQAESDLSTFTSHERLNVCSEVVNTFLRDVVSHAQQLADTKPEGWTDALHLKMHQTVAAIQHECLRNWKGIKLCKCKPKKCKCRNNKIGMIEIIQAHQMHFTLRDDTSFVYWAAHDAPADGVLYYHADFPQHNALPMGPDDSSDWGIS